jgi:predicted nucleic acid-binding protein
MSNFPKTALADSGFWYALYDSRDSYHVAAEEKSNLLQTMNVLLPWPCLYETFNTRFAKNKFAVRQFEIFLQQPHVCFIKDEVYREKALEAAFKTSLIQSRGIALVDMVLRLILEDIDVRKHAIITFNPGDFSDLCRKHSIEML